MLPKFMESHNTHGWLISAFLREMSGLEDRRCSNARRAGSYSIDASAKEASNLHDCAEGGHAAVEENWTRKRMGILLDLQGNTAHQICSFVCADNFCIMTHSKK